LFDSTGRRSRLFVHAREIGIASCSMRPATELSLYNDELVMTRAQILNARRSATLPLRGLISPRRCNNNRGMSIFTGHTSRHAPHKLDAKGSCAAFWIPINCGVITAPIGPGYTDPYA